MNRNINESNARYASRMWAILVGLPCLVICAVAIIASEAEAAVTYEPAPRTCYVVLHALGSKPVEVPCSTPITPASTTPQAEAPTTSTPTPTPTPTPTSIPAPYFPTASEYVGHGRTCFPADGWAPAPDNIRPCVRLVANKPEAGALRFIVSDASGVVRYAGYINTRFRRIVSVRVVRVAEDGSFTWKARSQDGRTVLASVGNLED